MARPRIRNRNTSDFLLYSADLATGWRVVKRISFVYGEHRVKLGEFRRLHDGFGRVTGYQPVEQKLDATVESDASRAALGVREVLANAGLMGPSRTLGLREMDRVGRHHPVSGRMLPEEDFVERARALVKLYPQSANFRDIHVERPGLAPGGDRAVRAYPKELQPA